MTPGQMDLLDLVHSSANAEWKTSALTAIRHLAEAGKPFQAADVAAAAGEPPGSPNAWGAVMRAAAHDGLIVHCGYAPSSRTTVAGSTVKLWRGAS